MRPFLALCACLAALTLSACASIAGPTAPPSAHACDIPRVEGIAIDGDPAAWGGLGLEVKLLNNVGGPKLPPEKSGVTFRLGWDDRGLLLLATVRDTTPAEEDALDRIYAGDSVEIFLASDVGSPVRYQVVVAPGVDGKHPELRLQTYDQRPRMPEIPEVPGAFGKPADAIAPVVARTKTADGYVLEALLPLAPLGLAPKAGTTCAFNLIVNDLVVDKRRSVVTRTGWYPTGRSSNDSAATYRIRLTDRVAAPSLRAVVVPSYERFRRIDLEVDLLGRDDGQPTEVAVFNGAKQLGRAAVAPGAGLHKAHIKFPLSFPKTITDELLVTVDGNPLPPVLFPDLNELRRRAYENAEFNFHNYVFAGVAFPPGEFEQPNLVEDMAGPYTFSTTYYDSDYNPVDAPTKPGRYGAVTRIVTEQGWTRTICSTLFHSAKPLSAWNSAMTAAVHFPPEFNLDPAVVDARVRDVTRVFTRVFFDGFGLDSDTAVLLAGLSEIQPGEPAVDRTSCFARDVKWWYPLEKKLGRAPYPCAVELPAGYDNDKSTRWPLILFLHGSGNRGNDIEAFRKSGLASGLADESGHRFVVVAPQCPRNEWWNPWEVVDLLDQLAAKYRIDPDRVYLTGFSMGGYGTWETGVMFPERFAALAPGSGIGDALDMARIKNVPTWVFHGDKDGNVPFDKDKACVDTLRDLGGRVRFTVMKDVGHTSGPVYSNKELYEWFLRQRRGHPDQPPASEEH